jgi:DNA-binding transcriptional MerR regulator
MAASRAVHPASADNDSATYTIDQLSAVTSIPSRTIRFYQAQGALLRPVRSGRVALYGAQHVERLELIGLLQHRGLRLSAIVDLLERGGPVSLGDWLGLDERLSRPWTTDRARQLSRAEIAQLVGPGARRAIAALVRLGLARPVDGGYRVPSPALLRVVLQLRNAGIDLDTAGAAGLVLRQGLSTAADQLVRHFRARLGRGFGGRGSAEDVARGLEALRPLGAEAVQVIFAQEIERAIDEQVPAARVRVNPLAGAPGGGARRDHPGSRRSRKPL